MPTQLSIQDFTNSVKPLTDFLSQTFPQGLCVSDVQDELGRQQVDLENSMLKHITSARQEEIVIHFVNW